MLEQILNAIDTLGYIADTPGAYTRGLLASRPGERVSGREMLTDWGVTSENDESKWELGDVLGALAEMIFDPTNLVGVGAVTKTAKAVKAAKESNKVSRAMRAAGAMPEEVAKLTKIVDEAGNPKRMYHGTPSSFDKFDPEKLDPEALYGRGIYFTDDPELASTYVTKGTRVNQEYPMNVRMHFVDSRNPLDGDKSVGSTLEWWQGMFDDVINDEELYKKDPWFRKATETFRKRVTPESTVADAIKYVNQTQSSSQALQKRGIDAIQHTGGAIRGDRPHNVVIALDPSQVYAPYIAPELQAIPSLQPILAALAGYNAGMLPERAN